MSSPVVDDGIPLSRHGEKLTRRTARWKPGIIPFLLPFVLLVAFGLWTYRPSSSPLSWVLTVVWSLPVVGVMVGIQGALLIRRRVRKSDRMAPPTPADQDFLIILCPTIGRHDTYPALERSVLSYVEHMPQWFPYMRVDILTEEGCEATEDIDRLAASHPLMRVVTVPKKYVPANGTRFKARANHYAHELRIHEGEALENVCLLYTSDAADE